MILMDGAMGTVLISRGVRPNSCFESLNLSRPSLIQEIHRDYRDAGSQVLVTNTFGANRVRLGRRAKKLEAINRAGIRLARSASPKVKVFASIGPLGGPLEPKVRAMDFNQRKKIFREQAQALAKENPDGFLIETMTSLLEAEAATVAVREVSDRTIITLVAPMKSLGRPNTAFFRRLSKVLRNAGADVLGTNCGNGPKECFAFFKALSQVDDGALCARPAGGKEFAAWAGKFQKLGCKWFGGCCGTTPEQIAACRGAIYRARAP